MRVNLLSGLLLGLRRSPRRLVERALDLELESVALLGAALGAVVALVPDGTAPTRLAGFGLGFVGRLGRLRRSRPAASRHLGWTRRCRLPGGDGMRGPGRGGARAPAAVEHPARHCRPRGSYELTYTEAPSQMLETSMTAVTTLLFTIGRRLPGRVDQPAERRDGGRPMSRRRTIGRTSAAASAVLLAALTTSGPGAVAAAAASDDSVDVVNTETVQVYMDADGSVRSRRVYEQLVLTGTGKVDIENPVSTKGLRNLDGFGGFDVRHGKQVGSFDVDGVTRARSVSDFDGKLPLDVDVAYSLNGRKVKPGDVVGEDGQLKVEFTVKNVTSESREVTVPDGKGGTLKRTVEVAIPMVGSLTTVAPPSFADVKSDQANMAGDGRGGTKLSFTMTLFPPIGSPEATFGYTASITDGVVPRIDISALPLNPLKSPSFKTAATSYEAGADTGTQLADGALEIDANLLKLRDGASDLVAGLLKLHTGSTELQSGLAGKAAPGAKRLAKGAGDLDDGLGLIDDGAGRAATGAGTLADGTGDALAGSSKLRDGLGLISGGLSQLSSSTGLPKAAGGVDLLKTGVDQIIAGFGSVGQADTLMDGLARIEAGAGALNKGAAKLSAGAGQIEGGLGQLAGPTGLPAAKGGVDQVKAGLNQTLATGGSLDQLVAGLNALLGLDCGPICHSVITSQILPGVATSRSSLQAASDGLAQVSGGLATAIAGLTQQLIPEDRGARGEPPRMPARVRTTRPRRGRGPRATPARAGR
jgi:putative membrane protein